MRWCYQEGGRSTYNKSDKLELTSKVTIVTGSSVLRVFGCCHYADDANILHFLAIFCIFLQNFATIKKLFSSSLNAYIILCAKFDVFRFSQYKDIIWRINSMTKQLITISQFRNSKESSKTRIQLHHSNPMPKVSKTANCKR